MTHKKLSRFALPRTRQTPADGIAKQREGERARDITRIYGGVRHWL